LSDRNDHTASRLWAFGRSPALLSDPIVQAIVFIALVSLLFLTFPAIDPWFSGLFYEPGAGFPMSHLGAFTGLRALGDWLVKATVVVLIAALVLKLARPARPSPVARTTFCFSCRHWPLVRDSSSISSSRRIGGGRARRPSNFSAATRPLSRSGG
jgi:hypothetical protein